MNPAPKAKLFNTGIKQRSMVTYKEANADPNGNRAERRAYKKRFKREDGTPRAH